MLIEHNNLSLTETPQPRIAPSRLNHNGHLTNSTTLPVFATWFKVEQLLS